MLLVYVDDILAVSEVAEELVGVIGSKFKLKKSSVGRPSRYLGGGIERIQTDYGRIIWSANCIEYVRSAIDIVKKDLSSDPIPLHRRGDGKRPFPSSYRPELDTSPELEDISKYQQYIGVLRWACELGRIDILTEVSVLSQHLCNPREGHLDAVYRIFNYLDKRRKAIPGKLGFDPVRPDDVVSPLDGASISKVDWAEFYPDAEEQLPRRMPTPHGAAVLPEHPDRSRSQPKQLLQHVKPILQPPDHATEQQPCRPSHARGLHLTTKQSAQPREASQKIPH